MSSPHELQEMFSQFGIASEVDEYNILIIDIGPLHLWISQRPHYCDRGRWLVHAESRNPVALSLDAADGFPRYYYQSTALVTEVMSFIEAHKKELTEDEPA